MTLNELNAAIIKWAEDREIIKHSTPYAQAFKTAEEVHELIEAAAVFKHLMSYEGPWDHRHECVSDEIEDAIGDIYVTLVVGTACLNPNEPLMIVEPEECLSKSHKSILNCIQSELVEMASVARRAKHYPSDAKGYRVFCGTMAGMLRNLATKHGTTLEACVQQAYDTIKNRTGRLLPNGVFVKDE